MIRLARYLKPYLPLLLITIILLFVQANADLALPDYLSKIVNVGIQQGGVENAVPTAIRLSEMNKLVIFIKVDDQKMVLADYTLINSSSPNYGGYVKEYPALASEPVYVLNSINSTEISRLNPVLGKAFLIVSGIQQILADPVKAAALAASLGFDLSKLPPGTDIFAVLAHLPTATLAALSSMIDSKFVALGDSVIIQAAAAPIKAEYAALGMDTGKVSTDYIFQIGMQMLVVAMLSGICTIAVGFLASRTAAGLARDMRKDVFQRVESFSSTEFDKFSTASLITRSTNDITQIQMVVVMVMRMVFYAPIIGVGGIIRAIGKSTSMWWTIALAVIVLLGIILTVFVIALPKFTIFQSLIDRLNLVTRESLSGMMVIRAFSMQSSEEDRFDKANKDLTKNSLFINRVMVIVMPFMMLVMSGVSLLIIWVGAHQVADSTMQVGDMIAFMQYAIQIVFAFLMMAAMFIILPRAVVSGNRIEEVLETEPVIKDPIDPKHFSEPFNGIVEFRNVSFHYPGAEEDVL
ncbi:ABC transporter ATP-binding protein, partial [Candidatus Bathyarchaeota archaeon]|nr:ABC transporter ATP-binding protein [Candidatus Bathyarchaeota archaeon]